MTLKPKIPICSLFIILPFIIGCATTPDYSSEKYSQMCQTWVGQNIDNLIERNGYPTNSFIAPNGNTVYVYSYSNVAYFQMPIQSFPVFGQAIHMGGHTVPITRYCITYFETDSDNIIIKWRWKGNACIVQ